MIYLLLQGLGQPPRQRGSVYTLSSFYLPWDLTIMSMTMRLFQYSWPGKNRWIKRIAMFLAPLQAHPTGVIILPAQTMHIKKGKSLENYHRFVKVWFPPKWVPYNDPRNNLTHFFWSDREVSLHHAERRAVPLPPSLAKGSICGWQKSVTLHPPRMPVEN